MAPSEIRHLVDLGYPVLKVNKMDIKDHNDMSDADSEFELDMEDDS